MKEYLKIAWKNIEKRKLRAFLTLIGILISVATIFILISVSLGLEFAVKEQFRLLGTDKFFVQPKGQLAGPGSGGAVTLTNEDLEIIKKVVGVKEISPWVAGNAKIEFSGVTKYTIVVGVDLDTSPLFVESGAYEAEDGRLLKKGDQANVMIGSQYKHNNFLGKVIKTGDRILINGKREFRVKGILNPVGNPTDDRIIYMPMDEFRILFDVPLRIDSVVVQVEEESDINKIAKTVEKKLMKFRNLDEENLDFSILTPSELLKSFGKVLNVITAFLLGVAAISLIIGGIGIANTMYTSVLERTKEIGVMKAIGAENENILIIFLLESGMMGLMGGILGVLLGVGVSELLEYIAIEKLGTTLLQTVFPTWLIAGSLIFATLIGAIFGLWPAYRALKVRPVEALRNE
jgi:putative ABC transport system permease protein